MSTIDGIAFKYTKASSLAISDGREDWRAGLIDFISDVAKTNHDKFFWEYEPYVRFIPPTREHVAYTTPDGRIYMNTDHPEGENKYAIWDFIYCHECLHQLWDTFDVGEQIKRDEGECDFEILNIASDCVINDFLSRIRKKQAGKSLITPEYLNDRWNVIYEPAVDTQRTLYDKIIQIERPVREALKKMFRDLQKKYGGGQQPPKGGQGKQGQSGSGNSGSSGGQQGQSGSGNSGSSGGAKGNSPYKKGSTEDKAFNEGQNAGPGDKSPYKDGSPEDNAFKNGQKSQGNSPYKDGSSEDKAFHKGKNAGPGDKSPYKEGSSEDKAFKEGQSQQGNSPYKKGSPEDKAFHKGMADGPGGKSPYDEGSSEDKAYKEGQNAAASQETTSADGNQNNAGAGKGVGGRDFVDEDPARIKRETTAIIKKYAGSRSGSLGEFVKKCQASKEGRGLVMKQDDGASHWNKAFNKEISSFVKQRVYRKRIEEELTYSRIRRGSGFIEWGKPIDPGLRPVEDKIKITLTFWVDDSSSMSGDRIQNAWDAVYNIIKILDRDWSKDQDVEGPICDLYAWDYAVKRVPFGQRSNGNGGGTMPLSKLVNDIADVDPECMINVIVTDGDFENSSESDVFSGLKRLEGLTVCVVNKYVDELKRIEKKAENFRYIEADNSFSVK